MKCIVKGCENHKNEGGFEDGMCLPCYLFITTGEGIYSQAYRNAKPAELTDEEIYRLLADSIWAVGLNTDCLDEQNWADGITVARAILRKAQEK